MRRVAWRKPRSKLRWERRLDDRIFQLRWRLYRDLGPARQVMLGIDGFAFMGELRAIAIAKHSLKDALEDGRSYRATLAGDD